MKKRLIILTLAVLFILSGCSFELLSPESLIAAPSHNREKVELKQIVCQFLDGDEYLTVPAKMETQRGYAEENIDIDDGIELVAFFRNENGYEVGVMVFENVAGSWGFAEKVVISGTGIDYFYVTDMDKTDNQKEILLGVNLGGYKYLYIYHYNGSELNLVCEEIEYQSIAFGTLLSADKNQIVTVIQDTTKLEPTSKLAVYEKTPDGIVKICEQTYNGYCNEIVCGKISENEYGLYTKMMHTYQMSSVYLIALENNVLKTKTSYLIQDAYTKLENTQIFSDINKDGIIEMFQVVEPLVNQTGADISQYLRIWQNWDSENGLTVQKAQFVNKNDGYSIDFPLEWLDSMSYSFAYQGEIPWIIFYYNDNGKQVPVVSVAAVEESVYEQDVALKNTAVFLGNNPIKKKHYIAYIAVNMPDNFYLDEKMLISYLTIDGGK